ncbi:unnamed protein product [Oikopleura dioica]|uniref:Uncharacterized protein n=1 Tax=Oikopleura dioica TaxID=34765 RepID=E4XKB6_OIKDI|nr:unnamed protein product [Oikopleura dioica]
MIIIFFDLKKSSPERRKRSFRLFTTLPDRSIHKNRK